MRTFTLLFLSLITSLSVSAQAFIIEEPATIAGSYLIDTATYGANISSMVWCGELVYADPNDGCTALTQDMTGNIAMIDRGDCEFGLKTLNAQDAGAVAVVIVNNIPGGPVGMAGGLVGDQVTIPAIMISLEDGDVIKAALGDETINACMGNIVFDNDLRSGVMDIIIPYTSTLPANQIEEEGSAEFTPEARVTNIGNNTMTNITGSASIDFTPLGSMTSSNVYTQETEFADELEAGENAVEDFEDFDYSQSEAGSYMITYSFDSDSLEEQTADNAISSEFFVTDNIFCKGGWDFETDRPVVNSAFATGDGGTIEYFAGYHVLNGDGMTIDSIKSYVSIAEADAPSLEDISIEARIYIWDDANDDDDASSDEVTYVANGIHTFDENATDAEYYNIPISNVLTLEQGYELADDTKLFVGVSYVGTFSVFFGFDNTTSSQLASDEGYTGPTNTEIPYFFSIEGQDAGTGVPDFDGALQQFNNSQDHLAVAMYVSGMGVNTAELDDNEAKLELFPNPASSVLTSRVSLEEVTSKLEYQIFDMQGRVIFSVVKDNVQEDVNEFNIEQLPAGVYNLNITTDKGIKTERFNVQR